MLTSEKPRPPGADSSFLRPFRPAQVSSFPGLGRKKASVQRWLFTCAERQGFEPWRRLPVDRLAICSITTLAPLQNIEVKSNSSR